MPSDVTTPALRGLAERWWVLVLRGLAAILFGIAAVVAPELGALTLVAVWGAYALLDGVLNLTVAAWYAGAGRRSGWLSVAGVVSLAAGVVAFAWPDMTPLVLLTAIAIWAITSGIVELAAAIRLRGDRAARGLLGATGALAIVLGALLLAFPDAGTRALVWIIAAYALVVGVVLIAFGRRLRRARRAAPPRITPAATPARPPPARTPPGAAPAAAPRGS